MYGRALKMSSCMIRIMLIRLALPGRRSPASVRFPGSGERTSLTPAGADAAA